MPHAYLPLVDPEFHFVERRPAMLHAYARGLLQQLRKIRAREKAKGYPIATIRSAAVWLIDSYVQAGIAPAPEAARLIEELIQPNQYSSTLPVRRSSERAYLEAIEFEAGHARDPAGKEPSIAKRYAVAKHVLGLLKKDTAQKTAEAVIRGWRKLRHYRENVALNRPAARRVNS